MVAKSAVKMIPVFRPDISEDVIDAVSEVLRSGWIGPGPRVAEFEQAFARHVGAGHAVSTNNCTSALKAALFAVGVVPGSEVITPSFTWVSVFQVIRALNAVPVFADIEPRYLTLDPEDVARKISSRTRAIVTVHHGGQISDVESLGQIAAANGVALIEDAAHACGAAWRGQPVGSLRSPAVSATCFSFNAMKNLAIGDGGMMVTANADVAERAACYRSLGIDRDTYLRYGRNLPPSNRSRWDYDVTSDGDRIHMNDIAAAAGLVQLGRLAAGNRRRAELAARYAESFAGMPGVDFVRPHRESAPSWHMFTALVDDRDRFVERMRDRGVTLGVHYRPIHMFTKSGELPAELPTTEELWQRVVSLPMYVQMTDDDQSYVIECARECLRD